MLLTGAAGGIGRRVRPLLRDHYTLRVTDVTAPAEATGDEVVVGDLLDADILARAVNGVDAVIHLAGNPRPDSTWDEVEAANVRMTEQVLAAALEAGVPRVVLASSVHASGGYNRDGQTPVDPRWSPRPCCLYGASKAAVESLGTVYSGKYGLSVACLRIAWAIPTPHLRKALSMWVSTRDLAQLMRCSVDSDVPFGVYFGVSNNTDNPWLIDNARAELGYEPEDNGWDQADHIVPDPDERDLACF